MMIINVSGCFSLYRLGLQHKELYSFKLANNNNHMLLLSGGRRLVTIDTSNILRYWLVGNEGLIELQEIQLIF
jgi:hypothetical protein